MRGVQNFNNLFNKSVTVSEVTAKRKGRDAANDEMRNSCLLHRYLYHAVREPEPGISMSYQCLVSTVATEFFLSKERVIDIVNDNSITLKELKAQYKEVPFNSMCRDFGRMWPHFLWK